MTPTTHSSAGFYLGLNSSASTTRSGGCRHDAIQGEYSQLLASSVFCLVIPGDGWSARMDDATLHGCIPVIIMVRRGVEWGEEWRKGVVDSGSKVQCRLQRLRAP